MRIMNPGCRTFIVTWLFLIAALVGGCDGGLSPDLASIDPGFSGTLRIVSDFPPADSLRDLRVVAFKVYPPKDIVFEVISGRAVFSESLKAESDIIPYIVQQPGIEGIYPYVVVARQYGPDVMNDWHVVGVYTKTNDPKKPDGIVIEPNKVTEGIDINIDFYNLPPQPF
ncbi:MAG: hypothetical protein GXO82_04010 [Chlorobi bacterium]|nr:hypothetical protein [Chlorobiota bacterium]